jgi:hypothetical protein
MAVPIKALAVVAALGLAGYAAWTVLDTEVTDEAVSDVLVDADGEPLDDREIAERERRRFAAAARTFDPRNVDSALPSEADEVEPPVEDGSATITPSNARIGFDYAMRRVEKLADTRKRLEPEQWQALYREANDAYAALSIVLDAEHDAERTELEEAHRRLQEGLRRVRVRGKKFGP